jgi:starch synthase
MTKQPRVSLVHFTGNPNSRQAARALWENGMLHEVVTTFGFRNEAAIERVCRRFPASMRAKLRRELSRRNWRLDDEVPFSAYPGREIFRQVSQRLKIDRIPALQPKNQINHNTRRLDHIVADKHLHDIDGIYVYEDTAATTFERARERGIKCLYELPIVHFETSRRIMREEADQFPELSPCLQAIHEPEWKTERKQRELELAGHIFVASRVTRESIERLGVPKEKVSVIPYGAPVDYFSPQPKKDDKFRALFCGLIGPRKGVHYLLDAWNQLHLRDAELLLVGGMQFPREWWRRHSNGAKLAGSIPHADLNQYYSSASVFVFPSLIEGFAMVLLEAMACGIPIIATPNTAAPDIITDGVEGFIVPIRDVEMLKERIQWCHDHPEELKEMGRAARRLAEKYDWTRYRNTLAAEVRRQFNT